MPRIACKSVSGHKVHVKSRSARVCKQQQTSPKNISGPKGLHTSQLANVWCSLLGHAPGNSPVLPEQGASNDNLNQSGQAQRHDLIPASLHKSIGGIWCLLFTMLWFWWKGEKKNHRNRDLEYSWLLQGTQQLQDNSRLHVGPFGEVNLEKR